MCTKALYAVVGLRGGHAHMGVNLRLAVGGLGRVLGLAIMVYINSLRQKIEDDPARPQFTQNVRGVGYRFVVM